MKIALLCHSFGNIGHPFMRDGLLNILKKGKTNLSVDLYEQHNPFTHLAIGSKTGSFRYVKHDEFKALKNILASRGIMALSKQLNAKLFPKYDLAITAGGPSFVKYPNHNFEQNYLYNCVYKCFQNRVDRFYDLSLGSCIPLDGSKYSVEDLNFFYDTFKKMAGVSARDSVAYREIKNLHTNTKLIACPASWAFEGLLNKNQQTRNKFLVNFMENGANSTWGRKFDPQVFFNTIKSFLGKVSRSGFEIKFICHSDRELEIGQRSFPGYVHFKPVNAKEYVDYTSDCFAGIACRLHCAIPLARTRVPMLLIGHDSRMETANEIGLKTVDAVSLTGDILDEYFQNIIDQGDQVIEKIMAKTEFVPTQYLEFINS